MNPNVRRGSLITQILDLSMNSYRSKWVKVIFYKCVHRLLKQLVISVYLQYVQHTAQEEPVTLTALNKSEDYSHSTFGISFCCYLIHWQWSKRDEMQWRSKVRFKGIVLTCCISSLDTMLPSHYHSTHPRTHRGNKKKLPNKTSTARIAPRLRHKYYCNVHHRDM